MLIKNSISHKIVFSLLVLLGLMMSFYLYRFIYLKNFSVVIPNQIYRSAQPTLPQVRNWHNTYHLKSILTLRGHQEQENIKRANHYITSHGIELNTIKLSSRKLPTHAELQELIRIINDSPKPLLIHCMRGVDRSGLVSAIAALLNNKSIDQAREEFGWRKGFLPYRKQELLKQVINDYESWLAKNNLTTNKTNFVLWASQYYRMEVNA